MNKRLHTVGISLDLMNIKSYINCYHSVPQRDTLEAIYILVNLLQNLIPYLFGKTIFHNCKKKTNDV